MFGVGIPKLILGMPRSGMGWRRCEKLVRYFLVSHQSADEEWRDRKERKRLAVLPTPLRQ